MQEKPKRKSKDGMSRRRFIQLGIASTAIGIGAGITAQWMQTSSSPTAEVANCAFTWGPNSTRINEPNSALLREALVADGLNPIRSEVYDRAMEYETCYDAEGNVLSSELLYRQNEGAIVGFAVEASALNEATHASLVTNVLETLENFEAFNLQDLTVEVSHGDEMLIWGLAVYAAQTTDADQVYELGQISP